MPARPTWKGYLKISLVTIPIKVFPATDAGATLSFNQLHAECQTQDSAETLVSALRARGAEHGHRQRLRVRKGTTTLSWTKRTSRRSASIRRASSTSRSSPTDSAIDPIYLERPYYLAPDGPVASEAFAVVREGMEGMAGIGKVALVRPRVSREGAAAGARPHHVHAQARRRNPRDGRHRRARTACRRR